MSKVKNTKDKKLSEADKKIALALGKEKGAWWTTIAATILIELQSIEDPMQQINHLKASIGATYVQGYLQAKRK